MKLEGQSSLETLGLDSIELPNPRRVVEESPASIHSKVNVFQPIITDLDLIDNKKEVPDPETFGKTSPRN